MRNVGLFSCSRLDTEGRMVEFELSDDLDIICFLVDDEERVCKDETNTEDEREGETEGSEEVGMISWLSS